MGIITNNNTLKMLRSVRPEGQEGGNDDAFIRMDEALNSVETLNGVEVLGKGKPGRRSIPVDLDEAMDRDFPKWDEYAVYITGIGVTHDRTPVNDGQSGFLPRAILKGLTAEKEGLRPSLVSYSIPFSPKGMTYWDQACELVDQFKALPMNRPIMVRFAGNAKYVRTTKGDVAYVHASEVGGIVVPDHATIGMPTQVHDGHPTLMRPNRRLVVQGFWGYDGISQRAADNIERFCAMFADGQGDSMPAPTPAASALGDDLD